MTLRATYRVQFHSGFTFADAEKLVPYFARLGISHLYSSPIFTARAGSLHGYDVVDHARINPELGGEEAFRSLAAALRGRGIGILLDIVPNHTAVGGSDNPYWLDLLEKGRASVFAAMFDIDWDADDKVIVPMLGRPLAECISAGEVILAWDARLAKLVFGYGDNAFPLRRDEYPAATGDADPATADLARFADQKELARLLARQHFRLAYWREAGERINWRRFFDITSLAALRVEDDAVFEQIHAAVFRLYSDGAIDGVRVDHVDGLADPARYCRRLRARLEALASQRPETLSRERAIVLVEKILAEDETLPADWDADGTTGYDFMNSLSAVQHDAASESAFSAQWSAVSGSDCDFECEERISRGEMLDTAFASALRTTAAAFLLLEEDGRMSSEAMERAIATVLTHFRAYRTYAVGDSANPPAGRRFDRAVAAASMDARSDTNVSRAIDLLALAMNGERADHGDAARDAVRRFNQLAAPVAAKAVEDTAFYRYGRLLSRNDVGFSPARFAISTEDFHADNERRAERYPCALLATATHDHKRGEDARARIAALSEIPEEWERAWRGWFALNDAVRPEGIASADEYQFYQALIGAWPLGLTADDHAGMTELTERMLVWREKSLREAKTHSSWNAPNAAVEKAHGNLIRAVLAPSSVFAHRVADLVEWLAPAGALNSLVSCVLRCTSPGVPDLYQGAELWDWSMVDPDNRRPVDYAARAALLDDTGSRVDVVGEWRTGAAKLALIGRLLALRARLPELFARGTYRRLDGGSPRVLAFARESESAILMVAVPILCARDAIARGAPLPGSGVEAASVVTVPAQLRGGQWIDALDPEAPAATLDDRVPLFERFPCAVLFQER